MERIYVTVRARPLPQEDANCSPWRISGNSISVPNSSSKFEFDRVFGEDCKTAEVYEARTRDIVSAAVRGFNGTVFAYGQTNSGKTHTMRGSATEPGVIPLAVHELFETIQEDVDREFLLRMSYMEIYNEEINDLLAPEHRKLQIHESLERGIYVAGLREEIVASPQQVLDLMQFGESHRHIGETNMNLYSSRSHTIFRMIVESRDRNEAEDIGNSCDAVRVSVLNLVDLAGSERAAKTGAEGVRLKEGSHINKSLMTLGTVIKKLSEGAESQGSHVPYRDSKLTRILQPSLGGNANTAIICNITLAQIHADETKSSLQFASRALRVTNCARVNEILTDAALLKRQKKEIEELRAKLQGSHSEHLEEEILNLRNTLLQSELERERITLELEEEKRAQAEREKVLQEQAKKIKNLSSMVLYSNMDENREQYKKGKRRDTWCPGNLSRENLQEVYSNAQSRASTVKSTRVDHDVGPLVPFEKLVNENEVVDDRSKPCKDENNDVARDCTLPDPHALLHVTNRRKAPPRKKGSPVDENELAETQAEYEDLLLKHETERTMGELQNDFLMRQLAEVALSDRVIHNECSMCTANRSNIYADNSISLRESEAIFVIKQLQEKIKLLELESSSSQQNLDNIVKLATEQNICAKEKLEELHEELQNARDEAKIVHEQLASSESTGRMNLNLDSCVELSTEVENIIFEVQSSKEVLESVTSFEHEVFQSLSAISNVFVDIRALLHQISKEHKLVINDQEKLHLCMRQKITELENEKLVLYNQSVDFQKQMDDLRLNAQSLEGSLKSLSDQQNMEEGELRSYIQILENEISCLSSSSLAKEKESVRRDLEKVKIKLKETESKLKNASQEKTKLEGEKAYAEKEIKRLQGERTLLERDICKRESLAGRRRDSVIDKSSKGFDPKKAKGPGVLFEQTMQEDYRKLEVLAFEMETHIASLEDALAAASKEKEEVIYRNEGLALELEVMSEKLNVSNSELKLLQEDISRLRLRLEESKSEQEKMESSIKSLVEEKELLAMNLTDSLLEMEEEKAIWSAKEKASVETIELKVKLDNEEIKMLTTGMSEVKNELESCKAECKVLRERLTCAEENEKLDRKSSVEKSLEIDRLKNEQKMADGEGREAQDMLKSNVQTLSFQLHQSQEEADILRKELSFLSDKGTEQSNDIQNLQNQLFIMTNERDKLMFQIGDLQSHVAEIEVMKKNCDNMLVEAQIQVEEQVRRISRLEVKMHNDEVNNNKEKAKLRMRLRGTQASLDAHRYRYKEAINESVLMNRKFEEASRNLKDQLASYGIEVLNLKKQLASVKGLKGTE
ncbi:kinesin-like protein KIN-7O isoform X2 [Tripterygium wilfordii]|uniref:kinesin-like protein KIN-7O isoform X2 n=1 Tax=Tripterygium wilfordii TaxID=458696 RepID=UPI0018F7E8C2|nr:kinesin-like protein KIN-7O isoform X2 [Tripterygium wilfordii]